MPMHLCGLGRESIFGLLQSRDSGSPSLKAARPIAVALCSWTRIRPQPLRALLTGVLILLSAAITKGATLTVSPDGAGQFPTIQAALDASRRDDVIELLPGTFTGPGNRGLRFPGWDLTLWSRDNDPQSCVIDCEDADLGFRMDRGESNATLIRGITFRRGRSPIAGGAVIWGSSPTIENCRFIENTCVNGIGGGALNLYSAGSVIENCHFEANWRRLGGGAVYVTTDPAPWFIECSFVENECESEPFYSASVLYCDECSPILERCTAYSNHASLGSLLLALRGATPRVISTTLARNRGDAVLFSVFGSTVWVENSIIAFNESVSNLCDADISVSCSDIFGNEGGDWVECLQGQEGSNGNLHLDPQFCLPEFDDFHLQAGSPCDADCGLMGAWGVGCSPPVPVANSSWGRVKLQFR